MQAEDYSHTVEAYTSRFLRANNVYSVLCEQIRFHRIFNRNSVVYKRYKAARRAFRFEEYARAREHLEAVLKIIICPVERCVVSMMSLCLDILEIHYLITAAENEP